MKTEQPILITSIEAAADIPKNRIVGFDGNFAPIEGKALGVSNADASQGEQMSVVCVGIALIQSAGAIPKGEAVSCTADGKAMAASDLSVSIPSGATPVTSDAAQPTLELSGSQLPEYIVGYTLDEASGADELVRVKLN